MYTEWLPVLGGQSENSFENSVSNVQIGFIFSDLLRSYSLALPVFGSFHFSTLACKHF